MQLVRKIYLSLLISFLFSCSVENNKPEIGKLLLFQYILDTGYQVCNPHQYANSLSFQDETNDVKAGSLNLISGNAGYRDLVSGQISNDGEKLNLKLGLIEIPKGFTTHNLDKKDIPEYKFIYNFYVENENKEISIGIILYPSTKEEYKLINKIPVEYFINQKSIASCGFPSVTEKEIQFPCNLQSNPELAQINSNYKFNVFVENYDGKNLYKDCY